jgi:hypothetical protein
MCPRLSTEDIRKFALKYSLTQGHQAYQTSNNSCILKHTILSADIFNKFGRSERKNKERKERGKIMYLVHIFDINIVYTVFNSNYRYFQ